MSSDGAAAGRAGGLEVSGEDQDEVGTYFDTENFAFHGPDGFDAGTGVSSVKFVTT